MSNRDRKIEIIDLCLRTSPKRSSQPETRRLFQSTVVKGSCWNAFCTARAMCNASLEEIMKNSNLFPCHIHKRVPLEKTA